jgi:HD-like signal output (HDOD) protein/CheY-like chemotaxis protein
MTERPHVLFVDDEESMLSGLRRMLRAHRDRWDMSFALGGERALAVLAERPCDVVVSDFRMPGMDGGTLLQLVRDRYPGTARLILSGHTDESDLLKVLLLAHQFVNKPCSEDDLVHAIERVLKLRSTLTNEAVQREVAGIETLPSPPSTLRDLLSALDSPNASSRSVAEAIARDPAATAKILQVVNSSASGLVRKVSDIGQAVSLLGLRNVRAMVLMHDLVRDFRAPSATSDWGERLARHSIETSRLARHLCADQPWAEDAFAAGLLLEVGQLVLASCRPDAFAAHLREWSESGQPLGAIETSTFGVDHAAAGAYLLGLWGLPFPVIEAVATHTHPWEAHPMRVDDPIAAVTLAHATVEAELGPMCGPVSGAPTVEEEKLDPAVRRQLDSWRAHRLHDDGSGNGGPDGDGG